MARKINNKELKNVSGGSCNRTYICTDCRIELSGHCWTGDKYAWGDRRSFCFCDACYEKNKNKKEYSHWQECYL